MVNPGEMYDFSVVTSYEKQIQAKGNLSLASQVLAEAKSLHRMHRRLFSSEIARHKSTEPIVLPSITSTESVKPIGNFTTLILDSSSKPESIQSRPTTTGSPMTTRTRFPKRLSKPEFISLSKPRETEFLVEPPIPRTRIYMLEDVYRKSSFFESYTEHKKFYSRPPPPMKLSILNTPLKSASDYSTSQRQTARPGKRRAV
mmetsp:Transcript_23849/g.42233  ORF Transcript_23849/g.42233 Transcript_23849/m.42233 type:complete len:201 (+) Transcript_23849:245-847(+)